jgi:hypothetical protein
LQPKVLSGETSYEKSIIFPLSPSLFSSRTGERDKKKSAIVVKELKKYGSS